MALLQNNQNGLKVLLLGYYGCFNAGDDIILNNLCKLIREFDNKANISVTVADNSYENDLDITLIQRPVKHSIKVLNILSVILMYIKAISSTDIIIFGGGTQIFDRGKNRWYPIFVFAVCLFINRIMYSKPVLHFCVGIGPIETYLGNIFTKAVILFSNLIVVRDKDSYKLLEDLGCNNKKLVLSCDLAYFYPITDINTCYDKTGTRVGISIFPYFEYVEKNKIVNETFVYEMLSFIEVLLESDVNTTVHFIAMQGDYANNDYEFSKKIKCRSNYSARIFCHPYDGNIRDLYTFIGGMDVAIGMRLHFNILCFLTHIPTIALSYHQKVASEAVTFLGNELIIDPRYVTSIKLKEAYNLLLSNKAIILNNYKIKLLERSFLVDQGRAVLYKHLKQLT